MTKEQELMNFLHERVFNPILSAQEAPTKLKNGVHLTIGRMNQLCAEKMIYYFWSALATDNSIAFSKRIKAEGLPRFEDVYEEFRDRFNKEWLSQ